MKAMTGFDDHDHDFISGGPESHEGCDICTLDELESVYRVKTRTHDGLTVYVQDWDGRPPWALTTYPMMAGLFSLRAALAVKRYGDDSGLKMQLEDVNVDWLEGGNA